MITIPGYKSLIPIYESENSIVYRGQRDQDDIPVILKALKKDYPTPEEFARYKREYGILRYLNQRYQDCISHLIVVYALEKYEGTRILVMEDFDAESLKGLMRSQKFTLPEMLNIAIQISQGLAQIHTAHVIHKDINPSNIAVNLAARQVKLIDFGIAEITADSPASPTSHLPFLASHLEGTLAYISPEQTGRMNRPTDYRSDFYSLGITLYELFTGHLPFEADDPMKLVHAHIAKTPVPPHEIDPEFPLPVSHIIMKLLSKTPEERYQSARGITADLEYCLDQWQARGEIAAFALGGLDISEQFQIPHKLYGREDETDTLMKSFVRMSGQTDKTCMAHESGKTGQPEMAMVSGYSGVGKSALVQELHSRLRGRGTSARFIFGKFDQFQRSVPYSAVIHAFQELIRQVLTESDADLERWREALAAALGPNGQVIADVIGEVELITGPQPPVASLPPTEAQNRFNLVFRNFIRVFTRPEQPLVIFLDDLQWADTASLKLFQHLMIAEDSRFLLLIGAYRDNEVSETHPLMLALNEIRKAGLPLTHIHLLPLKLAHIIPFVSYALRCPAKRAEPLAELILSKTNGNPFFMGEFLKSLHAEGLIRYALGEEGTPEGYAWQWDVAQIQAQGITDNVVRLMTGKIQKLSQKIRKVLTLAACVGSRFELTTLSVVCEKSASDILHSLRKAVAEGLLLEIRDAFQTSAIRSQDLSFKFPHDQIQQAAYSLIPDSERQAVHQKVGRLLLKNISSEDRKQKIFDIVNHLNLGKKRIHNASDRCELAELNLMAGKKAKAATAYEPAYSYFQTGISLIEKDGWELRYELILTLYAEAAETAYLCARFEVTETLGKTVLRQARTLLDKARIYEIRIHAFKAQNQLMKATETALTVLRLLGVRFPKNPGTLNALAGLVRTKMALFGRDVSGLADLPKMTDPKMLAVTRILSAVVPAMYVAIPKLFPLATFKLIRLSLRHGNAPASAMAYVSYGIILISILKEMDAGYAFGQLALRLIEQSDNKAIKANVFFVVYGFTAHWKTHLRETLPRLLEGYQAGLENGNLEFAAYCAWIRCAYSYYAGKELKEVEAEMARYSTALRQIGQNVILSWNKMFRQVVLNLTGKFDESPLRLIGESFDEREMLPRFTEANDHSGIYNFHFQKHILCYLFREHTQALKNASFVGDHIESAMGTAGTVIFNFYDSLLQLAVFPEASGHEQKKILQKVRANQKKMKLWAKHAPMNHRHRYFLVEAELANVLDRDAAAMDYYSRAIQLAGKNSYIQEESLASELAGRFWVKKQNQYMAKVYLRKAQNGYQLWGAKAKVQALGKEFPEFLTSQPDEGGVSLSGTITFSGTTLSRTSDFLDLTTVIKASQAISGEIVLESLLKKLMDIVIENAGAEKGFLILKKENQFVVEARGGGRGEVSGQLPMPLEDCQELSQAIVHYADRTCENLVLNNAVCEGIFTQDTYVRREKTRSILCIPILHHGDVTGLLYLENNQATGAFTPDRVEVLRLLSSQASISIENAKLYTSIEQKVEARTHELNQTLEAVEEANRNIMKSLQYAKRIQGSLLPNPEMIRSCLPNSFSIWIPKDVVGGDIFYIDEFRDGFIIAVIDCTGHGVPGAFMTMIASSALKRITAAEHCKEPSEILKRLNFIVKTSLQQDTEHALSDDGLDAAICFIELPEIWTDRDLPSLTFSGARLPLLCFHKEEMRIFKGDRKSIGYKKSDLDFSFTNHVLPIEKGMRFYMATDGITDQVGGEKGFAFGNKRFRNLLRENCQKPFGEQEETILRMFNEYKGEHRQRDDLTVIGFGF